MNTKRTNIIAWLCAAGLLFSAEIHAAKFPAYLKMEGMKITGCDKDALPADLVIPDGVTEIDWNAFYGCISLVTISIPVSVTKIDSCAFLGCDNIKTVQYRGTLAQWCQMDNDLHLVRIAKTITMSDIVDLKAITVLTIPENVTKIGGFAFRDCTSLANVTIPASVTEIGEGAFWGCDNIKTVHYRGTLAQWCQMDNDGQLVANTKSITMTDVADLKAVATIAIPDGVEKIGGSAFNGCRSLATVTIPASVTEIGKSAFSRTSLASVTIPDSVKKIAGNAFYGCKLLATASIPTSVTEIGEGAFWGCDNIKTVQYRGTFAQWCQMDNDGQLVANAKTITMSDIVDLKAMTTLAIPDGVRKIGKGAFGGCTSLASITIPEGVKKIGEDAFHECESLANVTLPTSVTEIEDHVFEGCTSLAKIVFTGTKTQWQMLYVHLPLGTVVHCADGDYVKR